MSWLARAEPLARLVAGAQAERRARSWRAPAVRWTVRRGVRGADRVVEEASDLDAVDVVEVRRLGGAPGHHLGAPRREPATEGRPGQVWRMPGDALQRTPRSPDRGEGIHEADRVGMRG